MCHNVPIPQAHLAGRKTCQPDGSCTSEPGAGVDADLILYIHVPDSRQGCYFEARSGFCAIGELDNRPIAGMLELCAVHPAAFVHDSATVLHEALHILVCKG